MIFWREPSWWGGGSWRLHHAEVEGSTHAVCEWAALACWSPRGRRPRSRGCCSPPRAPGSPCCPSSLRTPAGPRWRAGGGAPGGRRRNQRRNRVTQGAVLIRRTLERPGSKTATLHFQISIYHEMNKAFKHLHISWRLHFSMITVILCINILYISLLGAQPSRSPGAEPMRGHQVNPSMDPSMSPNNLPQQVYMMRQGWKCRVRWVLQPEPWIIWVEPTSLKSDVNNRSERQITPAVMFTT